MTKLHNVAPAVNSHLATSIENSSDLSRAADFYLPTKKSFEFVNQLANLSMHGGGAHSLQGAYGAGKSSLCIFTMHQLASKTKIFTPNRKIKIAHTLHPYVKHIQKQGGMLAVPVIGSASPLAQRISVGLRHAANNHIGRRPKALLQFTKADPHLVTNNQVLQTLEELQMNSHFNSAGILLMIDEFGRQFEHMLATGNLDDLHLLQCLAELPGKGRVPFSIIIIQHHGLEHYTNRFMSQQHAEWEKVSGRFSEFLLNNTETDTANIIQLLLKRNKQHTVVHSAGKRQSNGNKKTIEPLSLDKEFIDAASECYPLHPMTTYILARLSKLLGQGDRTVVGWLSSHLDTGFTAANVSTTGWLYPDSLFLHFFGDIQNMPTNPAIAKRFNAVHSAYSRLGADDLDISARVLKTIGLLYFCQGARLKADFETIKYSMPECNNLKETIKFLSEKSLVVYRRYRKEYRVWEGSDFDIQTKLNEIVQSVVFSPSATLNNFVPKRILAHKHFIETGNHRTAHLTWFDKQQQFPSDLGQSNGPRIYVWLNEAPKTIPAQLRYCVWGVLDTRSFLDHLLEASALRYLFENNLEIQQDIVASDEVKAQLAFLESTIENNVISSLNSDIEWHLGSSKFDNLQQATSKMMDRIYEKSIPLHNEMINRERTSGQATRAVRLLIEAMVQRSALPQFGIDKFPPERLIYESIFRKMKIHRKYGEKDWRISLDSKYVNQELTTVMRQIVLMGKASSSNVPCNIGKLLTELSKPPYGLKQMPILILCCIYLFVNRDHVELYEDGNFLPTWSDQTLTRLVKAPNSFGINIPESVNFSEKILGEYRRSLSGATKAIGMNTPVNIAKDVLIRYSSISSYAKHTATLSNKALGLRRAIHNASSPADMLFATFPKVFGLRSFPRTATKRKQLFQNLATTFAELEQANKELVVCFEKILLKEFSDRILSVARKGLERKASKVLSASRMHPSHDSFLKAILDSSFVDPSHWLQNLLDKGLDILTPLDSWSDIDVAKAEFNFRSRLIWLRQAAEVLAVNSSAKDSNTPLDEWSNGRGSITFKKLSVLNKQLNVLPPEEVVPVLLELLRQHRGSIS